MDFLALVVVYNKSCEQSLTCQGLSECAPKANIVVYDNSTRDYGNRDYCMSKGWAYFGGTGNVGLSKAYNCVINQYICECPHGILCLFDDDSQVDANYFETLSCAIAEHSNRAIFAPILLTEDGRVLSPSMLNPRTGTVRLFGSVDDIGRYQGDQLSALNSGMAIRMTVFQDYRYDESLFLDCVDDKFIMDTRNRGHSLMVFPYEMTHHLSAFTKSPLESALHRFSIFAKDVKSCYRTNRYAYYRLLCRRTLRLTYEYKTFSFLKKLWKMR